MKTFYILRSRGLAVLITFIVNLFFACLVALAIVNFSHLGIIGIVLITVILVFSILATTLILNTYKIEMDENGEIREVFVGKTWRRINIDKITSVEQQSWINYTFVGVGHPTYGHSSYGLGDNFSFKNRFPFFNVNNRFLKELRERKSTIKIDPAFTRRFSGKARRRYKMEFPWHRRIQQIFWWFINAILIILVGIFVLGTIVGVIMYLIEKFE